MVTVGLDWILLLFPGYAMQTGLMNVVMRKFTGRREMYFDFWRMPTILQSSCYNPNHNWRDSYPFDRHCYYEYKPGCCSPLPHDFVVGARPLLYLLLESIVLWLWVLFSDRAGLWCARLCRKTNTEEDEYETLEQITTTEVELSASSEPAQADADVVVKRVCKIYEHARNCCCCGGGGAHTALRSLSFTAHDEVFALLGVK